MKMRSIILAGIASIILILSVGIIVNTDGSTRENKIRVAYFPNITHVVPIIGLERGTFANEIGNTITIQPILFDSGPQVIESIFAGSVNIAYVGPGPAINGFLKSEHHNVKILSGAASGGVSFIVHPDSKINSAEDFIGKRIAAPQIGNSQDISLRTYLSANGLKPAEKGGSVIVLNVPNSDIYTLFAKGDIDAAWVAEPTATLLVQKLNGTRLFDEIDMWPDQKFASVLLIANEDYVNQHPEVIRKWLEAHQQTIDWINSNPEETRIIFNQFLKRELGKSLPDNLIDESLSKLQITSDPIVSSIETFAKRADSLGYLGRHGYSLDGIFFDINSNSQLQEVLIP
ncbi:aliphatic sulfonate ABC transporter periplasmic ligand-binding protein [Candidatus Nitrosarchaeum limnium SFB1]|jgi:NitT/TauT family transport system substrate-binding protein|uniref:Aliphatic sulfonate ABC transporter periplasmic ligand-binding protein n=1 Tax=Candidatus Nitrosarchaeum limnium SFB1 TaxID=886738 RepID=F3KKJ8_9ARCH|nr:aliphatic sulfonate ABC transporter periplasmic ligand-binding protein [Candidatus Nitrosarchaeum limnium SFB1]